VRFALSLSPTIGPPSSLSPLAHPTSVPCRRKFTHLIRVPHQNRTAPLSPSLTPAALEASVVTILSTSVASLLPLFFSLHLERNDGDELAGGASVCFRGGEGDPRLHRCGPRGPLSAVRSIPGPSAASPIRSVNFSHPAARFRWIFQKNRFGIQIDLFPSRSPAPREENSSIPFGTFQVDFGSYPKISRSTFPPPKPKPNLQPPPHHTRTDRRQSRKRRGRDRDRTEPEAERALE